MNLRAGGPIRVVIIDDETLFAKTLGAWLEMDPGLSVHGYAGSGNLGWKLCLEVSPDVALVDVAMPDGDGITLAKRLMNELPETCVILLTGRVDPHTAWQAGQAGVQGLIDKTIEPQVLSKAIRHLVEGGQFLSPTFQKIMEEQLTKPEAFQKVLTNRELAVLCRLTDGQSDPDIGKDLDISAETVAFHRKSLRRKLDLHDDRSLVAYGRKWGIFGAGG